MDAFEQLIAEILRSQGYWVQTSFKVNLTKEDKRTINRHSSPRWEIDVLAYKAGENLLRVIECKSYLDSGGVRYKAFDGSSPKDAERYKLFNDENLRKVVFKRLVKQVEDSGACAKNPKIILTLAGGHTVKPDREALKKHFQNKKWDLWDESWLSERLKEMSSSGYENQISSVVAKLLLR